jgi:heme O synthase-like polyprenyltransferase
VAAGTAGLLSVGYLALAVRLARQLNNSTARQLLFGSLVYLPLLMLVLFVVRIGAGM